MSKCIKCGRELTSAEIPEFYNGMCEKCYKEQNCAEYPFKQGINDYQKQINQLKQQLEEYKNKENTSAVNSWDEMLKNCENCSLNECMGCEYTQTCVQNIKQQLAEKDARITELEDKDWYEACIKQLEEQNNRLIDTLKEKDKEIERLKVFEKAYYFNQLQASQEDIQQFQQLANQSAVNINYIAIQELEKVKVYCDKQFFSWENTNFNETYDNQDVSHAYYDVGFVIQQQINDLRGEKDERI